MGIFLPGSGFSRIYGGKHKLATVKEARLRGVGVGSERIGRTKVAHLREGRLIVSQQRIVGARGWRSEKYAWSGELCWAKMSFFGRV